MNDFLTKHHPDSPNGVDDVERNESGNTAFAEIIESRVSRRAVLKGGFGVAAGSFIGAGLTGCIDLQAAPGAGKHFQLGFAAVPKSTADVLSIPPGYSAQILYRVGDPLDTTTPAYQNDGSDSADSFAQRAGDHHDGMEYFGLKPNGKGKLMSNAGRGLLCMNHENITEFFLHTAAELAAGYVTSNRVISQVDKEVNAHGVSVIEVARDGKSYAINRASAYNRRYTAASEMEISGPVRGDELVKSKYSPDGTKTRGTLNNCAHGITPWGTYLTCEENWAGYFKRPTSSSLASKPRITQNRYIGSGASNGSYGWANPAGGDNSGVDLYNRWNITPTAGDAASDFRNAANTFGWVVEIDPFAPEATPRKRTALGRFGHEGAMPAKAVTGKPIVYYMGDDARGEYIYKYVSSRKWNPSDADGGLAAGDKYLDDGKLYVAKFNADGSGVWIELSLANIPASYTAYSFANQADVLTNCRLAADAVGATPMDRPEWTGVHPLTGDIYVTLTNNSNRGKTGTTGGGFSYGLDPVNPRYYADLKGSSNQTGNVNGHIVRMKEAGSDAAALAFQWDIYLFGAQADADGARVNVSGLTDDNDFSSPDGLWFSQAIPGLMWLQTDDGAYTDVTNCMMLAAVPGRLGDGQAQVITSQAVPTNGGADQSVATLVGEKASSGNLRRFLVGPKGCEITGITETPDGRAIFVNIQHPGESTSSATVAANNAAAFQSHWPDGGLARPRSATIVITKDDGGVIGS
jgi:hypothetical protein